MPTDLKLGTTLLKMPLQPGNFPRYIKGHFLSISEKKTVPYIQGNILLSGNAFYFYLLSSTVYTVEGNRPRPFQQCTGNLQHNYYKELQRFLPLYSISMSP